MGKRKRKQKKKVIHYPAAQIPPEVREKYRGMVVAVVNGEVVTGSHNVKEAHDKALELRPGIRREDVLLCYIPEVEADYYIYEHVHLSIR